VGDRHRPEQQLTRGTQLDVTRTHRLALLCAQRLEAHPVRREELPGPRQGEHLRTRGLQQVAHRGELGRAGAVGEERGEEGPDCGRDQQADENGAHARYPARKQLCTAYASATPEGRRLAQGPAGLAPVRIARWRDEGGTHVTGHYDAIV